MEVKDTTKPLYVYPETSHLITGTNLSEFFARICNNKLCTCKYYQHWLVRSNVCLCPAIPLKCLFLKYILIGCVTLLKLLCSLLLSSPVAVLFQIRELLLLGLTLLLSR